MSLKGGYKIIDFKNVILSGTPATIPGIYEAIEGNFKKPLLASGICTASKEFNDQAITPVVVSDDFVIEILDGRYTVTITDDDAVSIAENGAKFIEAPASASSDGIAGQMAIDENYIYVCVADDTWKRAALSTWS